MQFIYKILIASTFVFASQSIYAQAEKVYQTFKDTRVINSHSIETIPAGKLDMRIGHRFGDFGGDNGGWPTFYGLENASDVLIGFDYGLSNDMMIGLARTKGAGPLRQNIHGKYKVRFITQEKNGNQPISVGLVGMMSYSTMQKSESEGVLNFFEKPDHRISYHIEMILARKFGNRFSLQVAPAYTYRNIVPSLDENALVSIGAAARIQATKAIGILLDGKYIFSEQRGAEGSGFYAPLGIAIEWETGGGHVFALNFTNAAGIMETDYIPYTQSNWADGEFRMGFTISRLFTL